MNDEQKRLAEELGTAFSEVMRLSGEYAIAQEKYEAAVKAFDASRDEEVSLPVAVAMDATAAMIRNAGS